MRIVVEDRNDAPTIEKLKAIAMACEELGHAVTRWKHNNGSSDLPECDVAFIWNGLHHVYNNALKNNCRFIFCENGWLPPGETIQIDPDGINFGASWAKESIDYIRSETVPVRGGKLLVTLQSNGDSQIREYSPWFANDIEFVKHLLRYSQIDIRVRPHPVVGANDAMKRLVMITDGLEYDDSHTIEEAFDKASAVACINSTCGIQAIQAGLPVLCYGEAMYRHERVVWCMDNSGLTTYCRTQQLKHGRCNLFVNAQKAMTDRVLSHQYTIDQIPNAIRGLL